MTNSPNFFQRVYQVVRMIPPGQVATYGQIAEIVSHRRAARTVGWALNGLPEGSDVPWQRVINARGEISLGRRGGAAATQRALLEREGIEFDAKGRIDLVRCQWPGLDWPEIEELRARWNAGIKDSGLNGQSFYEKAGQV
jgi:methylated-DNA-protein-cysteine methyltransferase-like protein